MSKVIDVSAQEPSVRKELENLCDKLSVSKDKELKKRALTVAGTLLYMTDREVRKTLGAW